MCKELCRRRIDTGYDVVEGVIGDIMLVDMDPSITPRTLITKLHHHQYGQVGTCELYDRVSPLLVEVS